MDLDLLTKVLGWVSAINLGILIIWFLFFIFARDFIYKIHSKWFKIPDEKFDTIHYCFMGAYELSILLFFLAPYIALRIVT
jgi:hypothetical protein